MFWLNETTHCWLCRRAFLLCCVLPTALVGSWIAWTRLDTTRSAYEAGLSNELGLRVRCSGVSFPRPGVTVFDGLDLSPGQSWDPVVHIPRLEIDRSQDVVTATIDSAEIHVSDLLMVSRPLWRQLERDGCGQLRLLVRSLPIDGIAQASPITVTVQLGQSDQGNRAVVSLRQIGPEPIELASVGIVRDPTASSGGPTIHLHSQCDLPCDLLAAFWPAAKRLGEKSRFHGNVRAQETADGWYATIDDALLTNVNLNSLAAGRLPYQVAGRATIKVSKAQVSENRLQHATGNLATGPGVIEHRLLEAAEKELGLKLAIPSGNRHSPVKFDTLGLSFELDTTGVLIQGRCGGDSSGTLLLDSTGSALASQNQPRKLPISALIRTVVGDSQDVLPASQQAAELARLLPLPGAERRSLK
jgi:hypothetical protein